MTRVRHNLFIAIVVIVLVVVAWLVWSSIATEENIPSRAKKVFNQQSFIKSSCDMYG